MFSCIHEYGLYMLVQYFAFIGNLEDSMLRSLGEKDHSLFLLTTMSLRDKRCKKTFVAGIRT